jgi:hypothetical protein
MEMLRLWYTPTLELRFSREEAEFLVDRAKRHYDGTCQAAGMSYEDGARENGFIKQLVLFPGRTAVWTSRQLDLTAKVLEHFAGQDTRMRKELAEQISAAFFAIQTKYRELNGA